MSFGQPLWVKSFGKLSNPFLPGEQDPPALLAPGDSRFVGPGWDGSELCLVG